MLDPALVGFTCDYCVKAETKETTRVSVNAEMQEKVIPQLFLL